MEGQKSQARLTRTQSSLLRSSPTVRSSIHSMSFVNEIAPSDEQEPDLEEQKPHKKPSGAAPASFVFRPFRSGSAREAPALVASLFSLYILSVFFNWEDVRTSENLLLALSFVAVILFMVRRNKKPIRLGYIFLKRLCEDYAKRVGFTPKKSSKPVECNGDLYEGEFHKGRCNGSGVYSYIGNGRYEGDWVDGRYDGFGIESWAKGSKYKGQYRLGLRHGYGIYRFYTGDTYAGEWCNGQSHGVGVQSCSDGSCYVGEFKCGVKHGLGCYHFRNGDRYAGEYFGDKVHGFGVYHFANGHCYEGSWHEGRKQGYGAYTFRNGETRSGEWHSGNLKTSLPSVNDPVLGAVQSSRKAAQNAINIRQVEDHVNKVVMSANRAATAARVAAVKAVQNRMDGKFCDTNS
nr:radial spoke head 10 homolog B-like [Ipomoea batatas]